MKKKRKEAEREGEASAIMVSKGALPAPSLFEGAFLGQGPASARRQGFTLVDTFKKKKDKEEDREGERQQRGFGVCPSCSVKDCEMLSALFTHHWTLSRLLPPPLLSSFLRLMSRASTRQRKELLYPLPPPVHLAFLLCFFTLLPEPMAPCSFL